jgi:hypothetical protein
MRMMNTTMEKAADERLYALNGAYTLQQFCERYHVSRRSLYNLRRAGDGPAEFRIGARVLITYRAAAEWEELMIRRSRAGE